MPRVWFLAGLFLAAPASASPLGDPAIERAVFASATEPNALALAVNPATLALGSGFHLHVDGSSTYDRLAIHRRVVDPDTGALSDGASVGSTSLSPGGSIGLDDSGGQFSAGLRVALPSSEKFANGGDATAYQARGGEHREIDWLVLGGAYRWRDLAFGVTIEFVEELLAMRFARDTALESGDLTGEGLENPDAREEYAIDVDDGIAVSRDTTAATFGAVAQVAPGWWVGASWRSPQGLFSTVEVHGTVDVTRAPRDGGGHEHGEATVRFALPQRFLLGVRGRLAGGLDLVVDGRWETLSSFTDYDVRMYGLALGDAPEVYPRPRGLRDELALTAGVEQIDLGQRWRFGGKLGFERGATQPSRVSAMNIYPRALTADVGVQVRLAPAWSLQLGYGLEWAPTVDTGEGAYRPLDRLACIASGYDLDTAACQTTRAGYGLPTASGQYGRFTQVARIGIDWTVR